MKKKMSKKMWGGRFKKPVDKAFAEFSKSIQYDYRLAEYDIYHSLIHVDALHREGVITKGERGKLLEALGDILYEIKKGRFKFTAAAEDIHTDIQNKVEKKVGTLALKLHSLRSRNDQIVFDEKFYCIDEGQKLLNLLSEVLQSLLWLSKKNKNKLIVGYTHLQRAQIIPFSDYSMAFFYMLKRDFDRIANFLGTLCPALGAGALAGTPLRRGAYRKALDKMLKLKARSFSLDQCLVKNPLDTVSERDFIVELLSALAILQMHLSRFAEDLILYSTKEFNYINLPEDFCTGSSLMPHKKNPDFLELVRGYTGRIYGNLLSLLATLKGLPLAYNRDMQLDKEPLFSSVEVIKDELKIMARFIRGISLNTNQINKAFEDEGLYATELAEFLAMEKKMPFKKAHDLVGKLIRYSEDKKIKIRNMPDSMLSKFHPGLTAQVIKRVMNPHYVIKVKKSISRKLPTFKK
jgi:argininosuccinate lyase